MSYPTGYVSIATAGWYTNPYSIRRGDYGSMEETPVWQALRSENEAIVRLTSAALVLLMPLAHTVELGIGAVRGLHAICTAGTNCDELDAFGGSMRYLSNGAGLLSSPYEHFLNVISIRPQYQFSDVDSGEWIVNRSFDFFGPSYETDGCRVGWHHLNGVVSNYVLSFLYRTADKCANSEYWAVKELCTRFLCYPLIALCAIVTRVFDGALGLIAAPISLLFLGYFDSLNIFASRCLRAPIFLIADLFFCTVKALYPKAGAKW